MSSDLADAPETLFERIIKTILVELVALPICFAGVEAIMTGEYLKGTLVFVTGIITGFIGITFIVLKPHLVKTRNVLSVSALPFVFSVMFIYLCQPYIDRVFGFASFQRDWPDAIKCGASLPENNGQSPLIFYYQGVSRARVGLGDVVRYFLVGGFNDAKGYGAHEIWFSAEHSDAKKYMTMLRPNTTKDTLIAWGSSYKKSDLDSIGQRYVETFLPDTQCGGDDIAAIKSAGNAFIFARAMK
jgi:hypothetical protein